MASSASDAGVPTPVIALDLGTSSVRALACDDRGEPIEGIVARRAVPPHQDATGAGELDPARYLAALGECLDELQAAGAMQGVATVATSSQWHSVLALDPRRRPASPALTWLDTRAVAHTQPADPDGYHRSTGSWVHPLYWTTKIPWLTERLDRRDLAFTGITEYVREQLLGAPAISVSMASGSGMLDVDSGRWHDEALALAGIRADSVPEVSEEPARLLPEFARRWPALAAADWMPATGDGATSTVGAGCGDATSAGVTVGTSAAIRVVHEVGTDRVPELDPALWRYRVDADRMLTGAAVSSGGVLHEWLTGLLGDVREPADPPGAASAGVSVIPMHAGSRPPVTMPAGSGVVAGLSLRTRPDALVAATYEGVALELLRSLTLLDRSFGRTLSVVLGGGAVAASAWWRRAFAATFARDVRYQVHPEVGARGAALVALGMTAGPPDTVLPQVADEIELMRAAADRYDAVRRRTV